MNSTISNFDQIKGKIYTIRGKKVMLDRDLAFLYGVTARALRQQVKRNPLRFPEDFMFQLSKPELEYMVSQNVTPSMKYFGGFLPFVFTQEGISMLSSVLRSKAAIEVNIHIMRAFVALRNSINSTSEHELMREKLHSVESRMETIEAHHLVDNTVLSGKITKLSSETQEIRADLSVFSKLLDEMQEAHIIIKRPDEENFDG